MVEWVRMPGAGKASSQWGVSGLRRLPISPQSSRPHQLQPGGCNDAVTAHVGGGEAGHQEGKIETYFSDFYLGRSHPFSPQYADLHQMTLLMSLGQKWS